MNKVYRYKFLVIDNQDLLEINNLTRKVNQAVKHPEPVLKLDAPWDQDSERFSGANIIYDPEEKIFKMWYCVWRSQSQEAGVIVDGGNKLAIYPPEAPGLGVRLTDEIKTKYPFVRGSGEWNAVPGKSEYM